MTKQKEEALHKLAIGLDVCVDVGTVDKVIDAVFAGTPEEHRTASTMAIILLMAAKKMLSANGFTSEQQVRLLQAAANVVHYEPEVPGAGVAIVGGTSKEEQN